MTKREIDPATVGRRLRERRLFLRISMEVAAVAIGRSSRSSIRDYESGRRTIPVDVLARFARVYHCKVECFNKPVGTPWSDRKAARSRAAAKRRESIRSPRPPRQKFFISYGANESGMSAVLAFREYVLAHKDAGYALQ